MYQHWYNTQPTNQEGDFLPPGDSAYLNKKLGNAYIARIRANLTTNQTTKKNPLTGENGP